MDSIIQDILNHPILFGSFVVQVIFLIQLCRIMKKAKGTASIRTFLVKGAFSFDSDGRKVALCSYYHENLIHEEAREAGIEFSDYLVQHAPKFDFKTAPISKTVQCEYKLPGRLIVAKESIEGKKTLFLSFPEGRCLFVMAKPEKFDPYETYWIGTCVQTDTNESFKRILKEYKKREKETKC